MKERNHVVISTGAEKKLTKYNTIKKKSQKHRNRGTHIQAKKSIYKKISSLHYTQW